MIREIASIPAAPQRLVADVREMKLLLREVLGLHRALLESSLSTDSKLDVTNERLDLALGELGGLNDKLGRVDRRLVTLEEELLAVRNAVREIAEIVPDLNRGPLEKVRDAIGGE